HRRRARAVVRGVPATVRLRPLDLGEPARPHLPLADQALGDLDVALRPLAARATRHEALEVVRLVEPLHLRVDPPVAERDLESLVVGDGRDAGALLRELEPDAVLVVLVLREPLRPRRACRKVNQGAVRGAPFARAGDSPPRPTPPSGRRRSPPARSPRPDAQAGSAGRAPPAKRGRGATRRDGTARGREGASRAPPPGRAKPRCRCRARSSRRRPTRCARPPATRAAHGSSARPRAPGTDALPM